jgi:hypothetical protein
VADHRLLIAALGVGCGGPAAAPAKAPEPVGNTAPVPVMSREPDERACRIAMLGELVDAPVDDVQLVIPRAGEAYGVCLITTSDAEMERVHFELSPIRPDGDGWKVTESGTFSLDQRETAEETSRAEARLELFELSPREQGVLREVTAQSGGPEWSRRDVYVELLRVLPDGTLQLVLDLESTSTAGEADDVWERTLTALDTSTGGLYDLEVAVSHRSAQWAAGAQGYDEEGWTEVWRFDGDRYALAETIPNE